MKKTFKEFNAMLDYHEDLNPAIWDGFELKNKVQNALAKITDEFLEFIKISKSDIVDIILTGSNANYSWTNLSDIDVHIVVDYDTLCASCDTGIDLEDCMMSKKTLWNSQHDIAIYGYQVELYVQPSNERSVSSAGVYSLMKDEWIKQPVREKVNFADKNIKLKARAVMDEIDNAVDSSVDDIDVLKKIKTKIRDMRACGLEKGGEFSVENLAFKALRNTGYLDKFSKYIANLEDKSLSLE